MKTLSFLSTTTLSALAVGLGLSACGGAELEPTEAQTAVVTSAKPEHPPTPDHDQRAQGPGERHAKGDHRRGPPSPEKLIERFDANKNGSLEATELPERMQEHIGDIDTSKDGVVSREELTRHFKSKGEAHAKRRFE